MTEREQDCIRSMLNFARGGVTTWSQLRGKMRDDGWSDDESKAALVAINPQILPPETVDDKSEQD